MTGARAGWPYPGCRPGWQVGVSRSVDHPVGDVREPALAQLRQGKVDGPDPGVAERDTDDYRAPPAFNTRKADLLAGPAGLDGDRYP
jgi:hypothetical protein